MNKSPLKYLVEYFYNKFTDPLVKSKLPTCNANKTGDAFTIDNYLKLKNQYSSAGYWGNIYYLDPNLDAEYGTDGNFPYIMESPDSPNRKYYSIRFDFRVTPMMVMTMLKMFMLDFDLKDYKVKDKNELINIIYEVLRNINDLLKRGGFETFIWHIAESDQGFHIFLLNHEVDIWDDNVRLLMVSICTDLQYAAFANMNAYSTRLSKKKGRPNDFIARPWAKRTIFYDRHNPILQTIDKKIIKAIVYKYNLIDYFLNFTPDYYDAIYYKAILTLPQTNIMVNAIRSHMATMEAYTNKEIDKIVPNTNFTIDLLNQCLRIRHPNIKNYFNEIKDIVETKLVKILSNISTILQRKDVIDKLI